MKSATYTHIAIYDGDCDFNPRTPWRVRHFHLGLLESYLIFQSTHSMKSATPYLLNIYTKLVISIHALHEECDVLYLHLLRKQI